MKKGSTEPGYAALTLKELRDGIVQYAKIDLFVRYQGRPETLPDKYREHARSLPPNLPVPKPIALAPSPPGPLARFASKLTPGRAEADAAKRCRRQDRNDQNPLVAVIIRW